MYPNRPHGAHRPPPSPPLALAAALAVLTLYAGAGALSARQEEPAGPPPEGAVIATEGESESLTVEMKRIPLPAAEGPDHPYTMAVPADWQPRPDLEADGVLVGPRFGDPETVTTMLLVRESDVDLSDPEAMLSNLRANAERGDWRLVEGEVRDFGGAPGLWIVRELPADGASGRRMAAAVKVPLGAGRSLDVVAEIPEDDWLGVLGARARYMLGSLRAAGGPGGE